MASQRPRPLQPYSSVCWARLSRWGFSSPLQDKPMNSQTKNVIQIMTQCETLAKYAARASFADLSAESRRQLPIHILDSLGCCIAALGAGPVQACREQVAEFGVAGPSTSTTSGDAGS